jgi:hypothetical protein
MRYLCRSVVFCLVVGVALTAAIAVEADQGNNRVPVFYKGELPGPVNDDIGRALQPAGEAPGHEVISTAKVKMYNSSWARILDKARKKVGSEGGDCLVVTSWGFDPNNKSEVKKTERVKKIEFEIARMTK